MARGKAAAQAANRRAREAQAGSDELRQELRQLKESHRREILALSAELAAARAETQQRAGELAREAVKDLKDSHAKQLRSFGVSEGIEVNLLNQKDMFIMNACRYVSMKTGMKPPDALGVVITWCTDKDFFGFGDDPAEWVEKVGVSNRSWTAGVIRRIKRAKYYEARQTRAALNKGRPEAYSLDHGEERREQLDVHPAYNPKWYPRLRGWNKIQDWVVGDTISDATDDVEETA